MGFFKWLFGGREISNDKNRDRMYEINQKLKLKNEELRREVEDLDERKNLIEENRAIAYDNQELEDDITRLKQEIRKLMNPNYRPLGETVSTNNIRYEE